VSPIPKTPSHGDDDASRFRGKVRHYHRKTSGPAPSWEDWIDADKAGRPKKNWPAIIFALLGLLALIAIGIGLFIEMR
jgi:hypothetical protein